MSKIVNDPGPALRIGLIVEAIRFLSFALFASFGGLYASVAALVVCDAALLTAMLRLREKAEKS